MREKKRETARALKEENARAEAKEVAKGRDETLCLYLERAERQADAGIFGGMALTREEFLPRESFAN